MSPFSDRYIGQRNDPRTSGMKTMPKIDLRTVLALLTAGLIISTGAPIEAPSLGDVVSKASTQIAENLSDEGPHLGFDTFAYPGDEAMRAWLTAD